MIFMSDARQQWASVVNPQTNVLLKQLTARVFIPFDEEDRERQAVLAFIFPYTYHPVVKSQVIFHHGASVQCFYLNALSLDHSDP